ncbi:MAG: tetratricopeptide repeat protein [Magnetococcales bacterium]|nr:tetratricopeptide repeat protein [Magnetococcales bacterium]
MPHQTLTLDQALKLALEHHQSGQLTEAEQLYRQILEADPQQTDALHLLGVICMQSARLDQALLLIRESLKLHPEQAAPHINLGHTLLEMEQPQEALNHFQRAADIDSENHEPYRLMAQLHQRQGDLKQAAHAYEQALARHPNGLEMQNELGSIWLQLGHPHAAAKRFRQALDMEHHHLELHNNLGNALLAMDRTDEAIDSYQTGLGIEADHATLLGNLANALRKKGHLDQALTWAQKGISLHPNDPQLHNHLGNIYRDRIQKPEARRCYEAALTIDPTHGEALINLAGLLRGMDLLEEALELAKRATVLRPNDILTHNALGSIYQDLGDMDQAVRCYQQVQKPAPNSPHATEAQRLEKNLLCALLYQPELDNPTLFAACQAYVQRWMPHQPPLIQPRTSVFPSGSERLRIGYLSCDLYGHPVGVNISPLLTNHDHASFEIFCYAEPAWEDKTTQQLRTSADHWRSVRGLSDRQVAEAIHADGIQVMVYLAGGFDANRPMVAAHRPAPIQVSFHSGTSTALESMDYWLTDALIHPPNQTEERFSERLLRLPNFYAYPPPEESPPPGALPADRHGFITFGSFNNPTKINPQVIRLWAQILHRVPNARLMLKFHRRFTVPTIRDRLRGAFQSHGINPDRLHLLSPLDGPNEHLTHYQQVDIALDPFPFTGATTTFQALWMGVPVVTLLGPRFIHRMSGDIVTHAGLEDWAVESEVEYIERAVSGAENLGALRQLRAGLRQQVGGSPLCDGAGYARAVEMAYLEMWRGVGGLL